MRDSFDKVVTAYFVAMTTQPFTYKDKLYQPQRLIVSPLLFRGLSCPAHCGACCRTGGGAFTLDYLPFEAPAIVDTSPINVKFNNQSFTLYRHQPEQVQAFCKYLDENARCSIHDFNPLSCSFEIMRFLIGQEQHRFMVRKFGRGWNMLRQDGNRGALCGITPFDEDVRENLIAQMQRLHSWMDYFNLKTTRAEQIIKWIITGPHQKPLICQAR